MTTDHEVSAKAFAELGSETSVAEGHTDSLFHGSSFTGVHVTVDLKGFEVVMMVRPLTQREHSTAFSARLPCLYCHEVLCGFWQRPVCPSEGIDHGRVQQVAVGAGNARGFYRSCPCASWMERCPISSSDDTQVVVKFHPGRHARTQAEVTVSPSLAMSVCCSVFSGRSVR